MDFDSPYTCLPSVNTNETQRPPRGASLGSQGVYAPYLAWGLSGEECAQLCNNGRPRMFGNTELIQETAEKTISKTQLHGRSVLFVFAFLGPLST